MSAKGEAAWARHIGAEAADRLYHPADYRRRLEAAAGVDTGRRRMVSTPRRRRRRVYTVALLPVGRIARAATRPIGSGFGGLLGGLDRALGGSPKRRRRR